jgi:ABC-2 type transport system permease protein
MSALVAAELLKLRSTRTAFGFLAATVLLTLAVGAATFATVDVRDQSDLESALAGSGIVSLLLLILGIVATTGEYRHRTITATLLATPDRRRVLASKMVAYVITGAVLGVIAMAVSLAAGLPWLSVRDQPTDLLSGGDYALLFVRGVGVAALSGAIGVAIGAIVRNQVVAVVGVLVYLFIAEPAISLLSDTVVAYTIGQSQSALGGGETVGDDIAPGLAALVLAAWALLLGAIGAELEERRDVT